MDEKTEKQDNSSWWLIIIVIAIGWFSYNHFFNKDVWTAHYLKTTDDRVYSSQEFSTADECANWMTQQRAAEIRNPTGRYSFECGSNCKLSTEWGGMYVCDETFDN